MKIGISIKQILVLISMLVFLSTMLSLFFFQNFITDMQASTDSLSTFLCNSTEDRVEAQFRNYLLAMDTTAMNPTIRKNIFREGVSDSEMLEIGSVMRDTVSSTTYLLSSGNYFSNYTFFTFLPGDGRTFLPLNSMNKQAWYSEFKASRDTPFITYLYNNYSGSYNLVAVKSIDRFGGFSSSGREENTCYHAMNIDTKGLFMNADESADMKSYAFLVDYHGQVVYKSGNHLLGEAQELCRMASDGVIENYRFTPQNEKAELIGSVRNMRDISAYLIVICDPSLVSSSAKWQEFLPGFFLVGIFIILISLLGIFYFSYRKRINHLISVLDTFQENAPISPELYAGRTDEINRIGRHIIRLQGRIHTLIEEEYKIKLQNVSAQYESLTAYVNPHFLYNTLNAIAATAEMEEAERTYGMILSLSDLFRYSADMSKRLVPLSDELINIEDYLSIQQLRYGQIFAYHILVPEELRGCAVPKLILQPIVENCFKHGFESKGLAELEITLSAEQRDKYLVLRVRDNGVGISAERLAEIQRYLDAPERHTAEKGSTELGLANVHKRLRLLYGENCGLTVSSGGGACIQLMLGFTKG